ncbi:MAG TPA: NAD(P)-binding domain-containing protein [Chthonomonadaceae bacterium]|nr:NAD(P)-binding domain-containing protein [Chthonomonadaceae bacterium]
MQDREPIPQQASEPEIVDVLIVGAGPAGLQAACTAQDLGLTHRILDRRGLAHSFVEYPQTLRFFSPPDEMAVGGVPFPMRGGEKPAREDILPYFRAVALSRQLQLATWERICDFGREGDLFRVQTVREPDGDPGSLYYGRAIVLASGVWDVPNRLACPGASLPHVQCRFHEPTEFFGMDVLVVGGGNSAVYAALALAEAQARVTVAMRRPPVAYQSHLRPFVVRDLEIAVEEKKVDLRVGEIVARIEPETAWLQPATYDPTHPLGGQPAGEPYPVLARFVFALLGQRPDTALFAQMGLCLQPDGRPQRDPETYETNVPGIYMAGSLAGADIDIIITGRRQTAGVVRRIAENLR